MNLDWALGLAGGAMIGLASALLLLGHGRIAGVSGMVAGLLSPERGDVAWRAAFIGGLLSGALWAIPFPERFAVGAMPSPLWVVLAGLLVGVGTRMGNGCTSGHGVCGISRGSKRSLTAVMTFMATSALTVFLMGKLV